MDQAAMERLFRIHREAEAARDFDGIIGTFTDDCYLDTVPLGRRTSGRAATRAAYAAMFNAFPDLAPDDHGFAFAEDVMVAWGALRGTSQGEWLGVAPGGGSFSVPFTNVATFRDGLMMGESIYFDLATLCEQADLPLEQLREAARG